MLCCHQSYDSVWRRLVRWLVPLALILTAFAALALRYYPRPVNWPAALGSDSIVYLYMAQADWSDAALWHGLKPPLVPFLYHALDVHPDRTWIVPVFQTFFSAIAWLTLGLTLASTLRSWLLRIILIWFCAALFCFPPVFSWNKYVLSESITLSWMILFMAAFIAFWRNCAMLEAICLVVTAFGFGLSKDTGALMAAAMIPCAIWNVFQAKNRHLAGYPRFSLRFTAGLSVCLLAVLLLSHWSSNRTVVTDKQSYRKYPEISAFLDLCSGTDLVGRWYLPFLNILGQRILPDQKARDYFVSRGFPLSPAVMARSGTYAGADNFAWYRDAAIIAQVKPWIIARGRSVYLSYLAQHWQTALTDVYAARDMLLKPVDPGLSPYCWFSRPDGGKTDEKRFHPSTVWMQYFCLNDGADLARFFIMAALIGLAAVKRPEIRGQGGLLLVSSYMVVIGLAIMFAVYYGDIQDRERHSLSHVVFMTVGAGWGYFLIVDVILRLIRTRRIASLPFKKRPILGGSRFRATVS